MTTAINQIITRLQPDSTRVISFLFNPGERPEAPLTVSIDYVSLVPLLEAIGMQLVSCVDKTFVTHERITDPDAILDMNGLFIFLYRYIEAARRQGHPVRAESVTLIRQALNEMNLLVHAANKT